MHFTELPRATRLLLVAVVGTCGLGYRFAIRDVRLLENDRKLIVVFHTPFECAQMEFALSGENSLLEFL